MMISLAGAFGASLAYVSLRVPEGRIAEMVGMLGTSGFVGLAVGPVLGDLIFQGEEVTRAVVNRMFLCAAGMGLLSLICVAVATRRAVRRRKRRRAPPLLWLIRRYHPGPLLLVAAAMGLAVTLPHTFLRPYTARLGIEEIRNFFLVYAATAFVVRVSTRRMTERIGFAPVILVGLLSASAGTMLYLTVSNQWTLGIPAILLGVAHALLFPAVVAAGSISFPSRYRGVATTLTLGMFDLGNLFGQPAVGAVLVWSESIGLPPYTTMFCVVAALMGFSGIFYYACRRGVATSRATRRSSSAGMRRRSANNSSPRRPDRDEAPGSRPEPSDQPWEVEPVLTQADANER
jgi:MFS family permease